jgi:FkbM family methyltransferase
MTQNNVKTIHKTAEKAKVLHGNIIFYDIGARDGLSKSWDYLAKQGFIKAYGFDPAKDHINNLIKRDDHISYLPFALGEENGMKTLIKTFMPGCSSFLEPNLELLKNYPCHKIFEIVGYEKNIEIKSIEYIVNQQLAPAPHFLKIDTQGFELPILKGASGILANVIGIELETQFKPMYKEQALFPEIKEFLEMHGFILRALEVNGPYEGEFFEADAYFSKKPKLDNNLLLIRLWQEASGIKSPKFLSQMDDWIPEWKEYLTEDQIKLNKLLFE